MRTAASVRMPSRPSEPSTSSRRSGPAAEAGKVGMASGPGGRLHAAAGEQLLDAAVAQRLLAGRTRDDPAAQGRVIERLREVTERVAVRAQLRFQVRPGHAGFEHGQLRVRVDGHERAHARHVDAQRRPRADGIQMPGDARAAAVWNHGRVVVRGPAQQGAHVVAAFREGDGIRRRADAAVAQAQPVLQALACRMRQAGLRRRIDQRMCR
ncbi:conserved hypothetical protein [Ricinus communis]|uniref:Uncharacterized protein n=1 Tax=Ricinus communis TaxID=3988 RepID=B9TLC2_RICCO|nr:conserved hypothetical protein [Ricinus communis]